MFDHVSAAKRGDVAHLVLAGHYHEQGLRASQPQPVCQIHRMRRHMSLNISSTALCCPEPGQSQG